MPDLIRTRTFRRTVKGDTVVGTTSNLPDRRRLGVENHFPKIEMGCPIFPVRTGKIS